MKLLKLQLLAVLIIGVIACQNSEQESNADLAVPHGDDVGDASLTDEDLEKLAKSKGQGIETISFADLQDFLTDTEGELVVCNFWTTSCESCIETMPYFDQLLKELDDKSINVVFINLDDVAAQDEVTAMVRKQQIGAEVVIMDEQALTKEEWMSQLNKDWNGELPATFFVKTEDNLNEFYDGIFENYGELKAKVLPYL
jgi:thiol-disulfide isomerase/thioredoxin